MILPGPSHTLIVLPGPDQYSYTTIDTVMHSQPPLLAPSLLSSDAEKRPRRVPALYEDILILIFDLFDTRFWLDRITCTNCALVCRAWTEPAYRVLWRSLAPHTALQLYNILSPLPENKEPGSIEIRDYFTKVSRSGVFIVCVIGYVSIRTFADCRGEFIHTIQQTVGPVPAVFFVCSRSAGIRSLL